MNEQYMRLRKEWREAKAATARFESLYNDLVKQSEKAFSIRNDVIDEVAKTEAFIERLDEQRPSLAQGGLPHFNMVEVIVKADTYDRLVEIAKRSNTYECAFYNAMYPEPPDED